MDTLINIQDVIDTHGDGDVVDYLLLTKMNGLSLTYDQKITLKDLGIPRPDMPKLIQINAGHNRAFSKALYSKYIWLTGSETRNKLFCWYCILFANTKNPYNSTGYNNLKEVHRALAKHNISKEHIHSSLKYKLLGKRNIGNSLDSAHQQLIRNHNDKVRKNRKMIKHLINMTVFLSTQEIAFRGNDETVDSLNQGNFKELAKFAANLDDDFNNFIEPSSVFTGLSKTIQNDLIDSITTILMHRIENEINATLCFSWEIDETTDISCFSQMSVIFRFVLNGKLLERFLGLFNVSISKDLQPVFISIRRYVSNTRLETDVSSLIGDFFRVTESCIGIVPTK